MDEKYLEAKRLGEFIGQHIDKDTPQDPKYPHRTQLQKALDLKLPNLRQMEIIELLAEYSNELEAIQEIIPHLDIYNLESEHVGQLTRKFFGNCMLEDLNLFKDLDIQRFVNKYKGKIEKTYYSNETDFPYFLRDMFLFGASDQIIVFLVNEAKKDRSFDIENYEVVLVEMANSHPQSLIDILELTAHTGKEDVLDNADLFLSQLLYNGHSDTRIPKIVNSQPLKFEKSIKYMFSNSQEGYEGYKRFFEDANPVFSITYDVQATKILHGEVKSFPRNYADSLEAYKLDDFLELFISFKPEWHDEIFEFLIEKYDEDEITLISLVQDLWVLFDVTKFGERIINVIDKSKYNIERYMYEFFPLLSMLDQSGFVDAVQRLILRIIPEVKVSSKTFDQLKKNYVNAFNIAGKNHGILDSERAELELKLNNLLKNINQGEAEFLAMIISKYGIFSPMVYKILTGKRSHALIRKTGSELKVFTSGENEGLIVHEIPSNANKIWVSLSKTDIPIAQVLRTKVIDKNKSQTFSRYCGRSLASVIEDLGGLSAAMIAQWEGYELTDEDINMFFIASRSPLMRELYSQKRHILEQLAKRDVDHFHPHDENFTVEFIKKIYLDQHMASERIDWYGSIEKPTINNIKFNHENFSFDTSSYDEVDPLTGEKVWKAVLRLIDWDNAQYVEGDMA